MLLISGTSGFIGSSLIKTLPCSYRVVSRCPDIIKSTKSEAFIIKEFSRNTDWNGAFEGIDCIIHMASIAHDNLLLYYNDPSELFEVNTEGTIKFALSAAKSGVKRFVFISSIGVHGNSSIKPYTELDTPRPIEPYAESKHRAEKGLIALSLKYTMEIVIIRPTLVYSLSAPGNFSKLIKLVKLGIPLPFASVNNKRSFIGVSNLIDFIILCTKHPKAKNQIFVIADGEDVSLPQLLKHISDAIGKKLWIFPFPKVILISLARLCGKSHVFDKLVCDLQVDIKKARSLLNWKPKYSINDELHNLVP